MLAQYVASQDNLNELSKKVDEIQGDIQKQTSILDKLNVINNEKGRRIAEIESYLKMKKGMSRVMIGPPNGEAGG